MCTFTGDRRVYYVFRELITQDVHQFFLKKNKWRGKNTFGPLHFIYPLRGISHLDVGRIIATNEFEHKIHYLVACFVSTEYFPARSFLSRYFIYWEYCSWGGFKNYFNNTKKYPNSISSIIQYTSSQWKQRWKICLLPRSKSTD